MIDVNLTKVVHFGLLHLFCVLDVVARSLLLGTLLVALYWMHALPGVKYRTAGQENSSEQKICMFGSFERNLWCPLFTTCCGNAAACT